MSVLEAWRWGVGILVWLGVATSTSAEILTLTPTPTPTSTPTPIPQPFERVVYIGDDCGAPGGYCPPITDAVRLVRKDYRVGLPADLDPKARIIAGYQWLAQPVGLYANPSVVVATFDGPTRQWFAANADRRILAEGTYVYAHSRGFGQRVIGDPARLPYPSAIELKDPAIDGRADARVMAGVVGATHPRTAPLGVWFSGSTWWAFNEDGSTLRAGERIVYFDAAAHGGGVVHEPSNDFQGVGVVLDDPRLNGNPGARLIAQHAFSGAWNRSPLAAAYHAAAGRWILHNANGAPLPLGETLHYLVGP